MGIFLLQITLSDNVKAFVHWVYDKRDKLPLN